MTDPSKVVDSLRDRSANDVVEMIKDFYFRKKTVS